MNADAKLMSSKGLGSVVLWSPEEKDFRCYVSATTSLATLQGSTNQAKWGTFSPWFQ